MQSNTFQVALVSDGVQTYSIFLYAKLQFGSAFSSMKLGRADRFAEAGFTDGTAQQTFVLPGSGSELVTNLLRFVEKRINLSFNVDYEQC